jgi:hypothetical protein
MKKRITFSLWGSEEKYTVGAIRNAELAPKIYPGWGCRFYIDLDSVPSDIIIRLVELGADVVEIPKGLEGWKGMFARFLPASEDDVDIFISRDCDSRLSKREALAVEEWMQSTKLVHSMADHPYHFNPRLGLMGGMFGMKRHACLQMAPMIKEFAKQYKDAWQCDQDFLKEYVYPLVAHKIYPTSDIHRHCMTFPIPRQGDDFVGSIIGPNGERLHPEHHEIFNEN